MKLPRLQPSTLNAVLFSLRTTIASIVALGFALWMELGEAQWAAMTVWIVARDSRGMSLSKGRWRIVGTIAGMIGAVGMVAMTPQHPWLFLPMLALWMGLCCGLAALTANFRAYALVLAGYTAAIIALESINDPNTVFHTAMARGSYIILGVVCEMVAGMISVPGAARMAQRALEERIGTLLHDATTALAAILRNESDGASRLSTQLGKLQSFSDQLEFTRIDTQHTGRHADRAYLTLGGIALTLSRGLGLRSRMATVGRPSENLRADLLEMAGQLSALAPLLRDASHAREALIQAEASLHHCRQKMKHYLPRDDAIALQESIVLTGIEVMLEDFCSALSSHYAGTRQVGAPEHHRLHRHVNWHIARINGARAFLAVLLASYAWEITAWSNGGAYIALTAVICARFSLFDDTVLISSYCFYGSALAVLASTIPVLFIMPVTSDYEILALCMGSLLFLGGLGLRCRPPIIALGAGFTMFLPWVMGLNNQGRIDAATWMNQSLALLLAVWSGVVCFRALFPFTVHHMWQMLRRQLVRSIRMLERHTDRARAEYDWVDDTTLQMEQAIRLTGRLPREQFDIVVRGTLSAMTAGRNLLMLRSLVRLKRLPQGAAEEAEALVEEMIHMDDAGLITGQTASEEEFHEEQGLLWDRFHQTQDMAERRDLALAIGSLRIIHYELLATQAFLRHRTIPQERPKEFG